MLLQHCRWEMMLTLGVVIMEMEMQRWIWELSESKSTELGDGWKCEVRWGRQVSSLTQVSQKTEREPSLWSKVMNSWSLRCLWHSQKRSHTDSWEFISRPSQRDWSNNINGWPSSFSDKRSCGWRRATYRESRPHRLGHEHSNSECCLCFPKSLWTLSWKRGLERADSRWRSKGGTQMHLHMVFSVRLKVEK